MPYHKTTKVRKKPGLRWETEARPDLMGFMNQDNVENQGHTMEVTFVGVFFFFLEDKVLQNLSKKSVDCKSENREILSLFYKVTGAHSLPISITKFVPFLTLA